jgi:hypothetical protein
MTFKPGHPGHRTRAKIMSTKQLSTEIREHLPASVFREFHEAVLMNKDPYLVEDESAEGGVRVTWDERGYMPTLEQKLASLQKLENRGWGQAPSVQVIEGIMRAEGPARAALPSTFTPAVLYKVRELLGLSAPRQDEPAPGSDQPDAGELDAIDAEWSERPAGDEGPASADQASADREGPGQGLDAGNELSESQRPPRDGTDE